MRILGASLLSMLVILLWIKFFAPKPPVVPPQPKPVISAPQTPASVSPATSGPATRSSSAKNSATSKPVSAPVSAVSDSQENSTVIQSDLYRVEISNRGAVVKSWQLSKYMDDNKPQRVLDVVHPEAAQQIGGWPFAVVLDNTDLEKTANNGLFKLVSGSAGNANPISAPADLQFSWSDGHLEVTKHIHFDNSYVVR